MLGDVIIFLSCFSDYMLCSASERYKKFIYFMVYSWPTSVLCIKCKYLTS